MGNSSNKNNLIDFENSKPFKLQIYLCNPLSEEIARSLLNKEKIEQNPFDIKEYELDITLNMKLKSVINQLKKQFNIPIEQFELYTGEGLVSQDYYNKIIGSIISYYDDKEVNSLYFYPKNELYEINIKAHSDKSMVLKIHDSMTIKHIETMIETMIEKGNINEGLNEMLINGIECNSQKLALNYNLRKYKLILLEKKELYG